MFSISFNKALWLLLFFPLLCTSHNSTPTTESEIQTAISLFEKAVQLSPDFLESQPENTAVAFYKIKGHKVYLDQAFWELTKTWLNIYIADIEKYCPCELDPELMLAEAKNHLPKNLALSKASMLGKNTFEAGGQLGVSLTAKYGYIAASLKLSAEVAETILSVFVGGKGVHIFCNAIDVLIFPIARKVQKSMRVFSYGSQFSRSSLVFSARMAWLSRRLTKSQKQVFFDIKQALNFNQEQLAQINDTGPKSMFHKKGHRLLWLEKLKTKTDPLFLQIEQLNEDFINTESEKKQRQIIKKINRLKTKIDKLTVVNKKNFFGKRFKRYLFLKSRKSKLTYLSSPDLKKDFKYAGTRDFWPMSLQHLLENSLQQPSSELAENITNPTLDNPTNELVTNSTINKSTTNTYLDPIVSGLIEEFLQNIKQGENLEAKKQAANYFILDLHKVFDTNQKIESRMMSARSIEFFLSHFLSHYLKLYETLLIKEHQANLSFKEKMKIYWLLGQVENIAFAFTDFLMSVSIVKNKEKIQFHKYESIEKLFAFLSLFDELSLSLKNKNLKLDEILTALIEKKENILTLSLTHEKRTVLNFIPFVKRLPKCINLVGK